MIPLTSVLLPKRMPLTLRLLLFLLVLTSCARVMPPEGGERDTIPPHLQTEGSTADRQTNFRPVEIRLEFDEWIQMKDVLKEVVISPPVQKMPSVVAEGKSVVVTFDKEEVWKDSTTYTLYFGKAIQDRSEGNAAPDQRFVFSTGPVVDSLTASGRLMNAKTGEPVPDALVILHRDLRDSAITIQLPNHFARTDKEGNYRLDNLRSGTFRVFALLEKSTNYLYDLPDEWIGWLPELIRIDSQHTVIPDLTLSPPFRPFRVINVDSTSLRGSTSWAFNKPPDGVRLLDTIPPLPVLQWQSDTLLRIWAPQPMRGFLLVNNRDSLPYSLYPDTLVPLPIVRLVLSGKQSPGQPVRLLAPVPLSSFDTTSIQVWRDSILLPLSGIQKSKSGDTLTLYGANKEGSTFRILFLPGALTSIVGQQNKDTLIIPVSTGLSSELVQLKLVIDSLPADKQVLLEIRNGSQPIGRWTYSGPAPWVLAVPGLLPGNYQVFLSLDRNRNGYWDPADYYRQTPAEQRSVFPLTGLRANWEMEMPIIPDWRPEPAN